MNQIHNFAGQRLFGQILSLSSKSGLHEVFDKHKATGTSTAIQREITSPARVGFWKRDRKYF